MNILRIRIQRLQQSIIFFNLFDDESENNERSQHERVSTWIYVILLILCMTATAIYTSLISYSSTMVIQITSFDQYKELNALGLDSFQCPCSEVSVPYKEFISIETSLHQVCNSDLIGDPWLDALFDTGLWGVYDRLDIRIRGAAYFVLLSALCEVSKTTTANALDQFLNEALVSTYLLPESEFSSQVMTLVDAFEISTPTRFATVLRILSRIVHGSTFISTYMLNWEWLPPVHNTQHRLLTRPMTFNDGCSCGTRNDCFQEAGIFHAVYDVAEILIPGFNIGCSSVDTLWHSTLECYYQQSCIQELIQKAKDTMLQINMSVEISAMDPNLLQRFRIDTPIQELAEALFIETFHRNISYEKFYNKCAPFQCSYKKQKHHDTLYIFTMLLSIYGGITAILRFLVPQIVSLTFKIVRRYQSSIVSPA